MKKQKENAVISQTEIATDNQNTSQLEVEKSGSATSINQNNNLIDITKPCADDLPFGEAIDNYRKEIITSVKRSKLRSTISMAAIIICSIAGLILLSFNQLVTNIIAWCLLGLAAVVIAIFFILNRRIDRPDFEGYVVKASTAINKVTFADGRFTNVVYNSKEKLDLGEVFADGVYTGLTNSVSRNVVNGLFDEHHFKICECALFTGAGRQRKTVFVGKYINFANNLEFENRYIFLLKTKDNIDQPTALEDLEALDGNGDFLIYGPKGADLKALFGTKFISKLKAFKVEKHLLNVIICVSSGHTTAYLSYDDLVNELPVDKKFNPDGVKQFQKEFPILLEALAELAR
ncbi:MAG: hypothetical protein WC201_03000 [Bacilli bacterium]